MAAETHNVTDLNALWDPESARYAQVYVSDGRLEVLLCSPDPQWVERALEVARARPFVVVIAGPNPQEADEA